MKRSIRILAVALVAVMLCMTLASCGNKLSGEYVGDMGIFGKVTYTFKGNKVEISYKSLLGTVTSIDGTYSIDDDEITISLDDGADEDDVEAFSGTFAFEKTDDGIKIGMFEYKKAE